MALDVDPISVSGEWRRHIPWGGDPCFRPDDRADGRWHEGAVIDALYLAEREDAMWAEWYRHLAEAEVPPMASLPRDVWEFAVTDVRVADLSDEEHLARVGLSLPVPGSRSWPPYQKVGMQLHRDGWRGLVAPSSAHPASLVLCVFLPAGDLPADAKPARRVRTVEEPPAPPTGMRT